MYTLGTFFALLSSWYLIRGARGVGTTRTQVMAWLGYTLSASALIYTHYYALFTLASHIIFLLGYIAWTTRFRLGEIVSHRQFWYGGVSLLGIAALFLPWLPTFLAQNSQVQAAYWIPPISGWSIPDTFYRMLAPTSGIPQHEGWGWVLLAVLPGIAVVLTWVTLGVSSREGSTRDASMLALSGAVVPFILSIGLSLFSRSLYQDRFFVFAHLFIIIIIAVLVSRITRPAVRIIAIAAITLGFFGAFTAYWIEIDIKNRPGARAASQLVYESRATEEPVLVSSPFIYFSILHYAKEEFAGATLPKLYSPSGELSHFAGGPILTAEDIIGDEIFKTESSVLWVVDTTGFGGTPLRLPAPWQPQNPRAFQEVFGHQASVFVTKYVR